MWTNRSGGNEQEKQRTWRLRYSSENAVCILPPVVGAARNSELIPRTKTNDKRIAREANDSNGRVGALKGIKGTQGEWKKIKHPGNEFSRPWEGQEDVDVPPGLIV